MIEIFTFLNHTIVFWSMVIMYGGEVVWSKGMENSLKNQVLYTFPSICLLFANYPVKYDDPLLSVAYVPFLIVSADIYFYLTHRPLHCKVFYRFHRHHHTDTVCTAKALDASGPEHVIGNLGSFVIGFLILQHFGHIVNIYVLQLWLAFCTFNTCSTHSNGACPWDDGVHAIHHHKLKYNYGSGLYIMDRIFETYLPSGNYKGNQIEKSHII